jgi:hypothetical protein
MKSITIQNSLLLHSNIISSFIFVFPVRIVTIHRDFPKILYHETFSCLRYMAPDVADLLYALFCYVLLWFAGKLVKLPRLC